MNPNEKSRARPGRAVVSEVPPCEMQGEHVLSFVRKDNSHAEILHVDGGFLVRYYDCKSVLSGVDFHSDLKECIHSLVAEIS